jgi:diguanylate cyclase (GGDEF)-like protein
VRSKFRIRPYSPIIAMVLLFVGVLALSLFHTMREADAVDVERTRQSVSAAIQGEIDQIVIMADDNGIWDDAATAVYGGMSDTKFFWSAWGISSAESTNYNTTLVLDQAGKSLLAYQKGRAVRIDPHTLYGKSLAALLTRLAREKHPVGGIARTPDGLVLLGVSQILPTSRAQDGLIPKAGPYTLVFAKPLTAQTASEIGKALLLNQPAIVSETRGAISVPLIDAAGVPVGALSWEPSRPGVEALKRALPWIVAGILMHLIIAILVSRQAIASVRQLFRQALIDSLSNLPNRRALRRELAARLLNREKLALAMIDLDGFKGINDNYGHSVGDRLIKLVSELLVKLAGDKAMVARLGGDEFAVLVSGFDALDELERVSHELLATLSHPFRIDERTVLVGASIGLASASLSEFDAGEMMRRADVAMYAAKGAGKMRLMWYDEMLDQKQATAHVIEMELRAAIEANDFQLVYQPVFGIHSKKILSVEALLRWTSPTRGDVSPNEFIPVAEATGLIDRIGMLVLRRACRDGLNWPNVNVAVNVSAAQLRNPEFARQVAKVLGETGFPADRLEIEITETYLVYDPETARRVLDEIRLLGIGVSLDDFGTGYASIGFLRQFAFSKLKLDRSLVTEAGGSEAARSVVQASIAVARALNMEVTAEGVETDAQADMMRIAGCDQLQGWLFAHAVSAAKIGSWVDQQIAESEPKKLRLVRNKTG